jgi:5'-methylthioadenosine phosphorylase
VTVERVIQTLNDNTRIAQEAVRNLVRDLPADQECACQDALKNAIITRPDAISPEARQRLKLLVGKYLPST